MPPKKNLLFFAVTLLLVVVVGLSYATHNRPYAEVGELSDVVLNEKEYFNYFSKLAKVKGSLYAFEVLRRSKLPLGVNTHSIAHAIGYVLFDEKGISGIYDCTEEFRSACSHAIVIQGLSKGGSSSIQEIIETCRRAPGGRGAYAICFHGVGHGFVASNGYDFKSAAIQCAEISQHLGTTPSPHRFMNASEECIGGAVMEMVQGAHDADTWSRKVSSYLSIDDPFTPCVDDYIPQSLRAACLLSLTQRFFGAAGISEDIPLPETYPAAMSLCATAPTKEDQIACYGGFGKEFVFYSTQFDGREVTNLSDTALTNIRDWCGHARSPGGVQKCLSIALDTLFWAGENDPHSALAFCSVVADSNRESCYAGLIENVRYFLNKKEAIHSVCDALPSEYRGECMEESSLLLLPVGLGTIPL